MTATTATMARRVHLRVWDLKCLASALCFAVSNALAIVHLVHEYARADRAGWTRSNNDASYDPAKAKSAIKPANYGFEYWKDLDPQFLEGQWADRLESRYLTMAAALFATLAWFWLMLPIVQTAWVLSRGGKRLVGHHMVMAGLAVSGSILELIARLLEVGMAGASDWMAKDFNMDSWTDDGDGTGWRVLEMIHIATQGMLLWVDAFEALALFGIVVAIFISVASEPRFNMVTQRCEDGDASASEEDCGANAASGGDGADGGVGGAPPPAAFMATAAKIRVPVTPSFSKCFVWYGLFVGLLAVADFLADVLRFADWRLFGRISIATNALLGVVFLPVWILCLAQQLAAATERFELEEMRVAALLGGGGDMIPLLKSEGREMS